MPAETSCFPTVFATTPGLAGFLGAGASAWEVAKSARRATIRDIMYHRRPILEQALRELRKLAEPARGRQGDDCGNRVDERWRARNEQSTAVAGSKTHLQPLLVVPAIALGSKTHLQPLLVVRDRATMTALPKPEWKTCTETSATISVAAPAGAVIEYKEYPEVRAARTRQHLFTRARLAGVVRGADRRRRGRRGDDPESQPGVDVQLSPRGGRRQGPGARRRHARCARAARPRARTRRAPSQRRTARRSRGAASYSERSPSSSSSQGRPRLAFERPYAR